MNGFRPYAEYDQDADAIYVHLQDAPVARTHTLDDFRLIDYSADNAVVGIEFVDVSGGVDLSDIPFRDTVERTIEDLNLGIKILAS